MVGWRTEGAGLLLIPLLTDGCYLAATGFIGCVNAAFTDVSSGRIEATAAGRTLNTSIHGQTRLTCQGCRKNFKQSKQDSKQTRNQSGST